MKAIEVEVFGEAVNAVVLRAPARKFPGILIQGDSLSIMVELAQSVAEELERGDVSEATDQLSELRDLLGTYRVMYEQALATANIDLPYTKRP